MKLQNKFTILVIVIIIIPVLVASMVAYIQFIYLHKNQMLFNKTYIMEWVNKRTYSLGQRKVNTRREESLPKGLDILLFDSNMEVLASSFDEFQQGEDIEEDEISNLMAVHMGSHQFFLEALPADHGDLRMLIRIEKENDPRPIRIFSMGTFVYLFLLLLGLAAIVSSLMLSSTNRSIKNLEEATNLIAAGNLNFSLYAEGDDELASLTRSFDKMRKALKEELDRRSRFLMAVSHDLKTPLTSIRGYLEAITDGFAEDPEIMNKYLHIIADKSNLLENRILELIDFVKMETGEWQLKQGEFNLKEYLEELARLYSDDARVLGRNFSYSVDIDDDVTVTGDRSLISRALENLFNNAVRYTRANDSIRMRVYREKDKIIISISDTGPGMSGEELELIFDPFYRGSRSRREQGFGLGLSIVRSIIHAHNWEIRVNSKVDEGTDFSVHIPLS